MTDRWQPTSTDLVWHARADLLRRIRAYFDAAGVLEVETQQLDRFGVTDPQLDNVCVRLRGDSQPFFLHTSPEYQMKRLLAAGAPDIYQICSVFRDGEAGSRHQPEFRLLEWYRHDFDIDQIIDDTLAIISAATETPWSVARHSYTSLCQESLGIDLGKCSIQELQSLAKEDGLCGEVDRDACLDFLLESRVTRHFADDQLHVIHHYPASQASLARLDPEDPTKALRFEVYAGGLELANGFVELGDAVEQTQRFAADRRRREIEGKPDKAADTNLLAALASGFPDCAGVALGLDRLLMRMVGETDIRRVQNFPVYPED